MVGKESGVDPASMRQLQANLKGLPERLQRKGNKKAVRAGGGIIAKAARKHIKPPTKKQRAKLTSFRTGLLSKSLAVKVVGRSGQTHAGAVVGPKRGVEGEGYGGKHVPANIAHLVEAGHGGPKPAGPNAFLEPAWEETDQDVKRRIADVLWDELKAANRKV